MAKAISSRRRSYGYVYAALGFVLACILLRTFSGSRVAGPSPTRGESLSFVMFHAQAEDAKWLGPQHGDTPPARLDDYKYVSTKYQASSVAPCRIPSAAHLCMQRHLRLNNQHAYDEFDCASQKLCTWRGAGRTLERKGSNASPGRVLTISTRHTCSPSHGNVQHQALLNVLHTPVNL
jgi:hypothetical protein